MDCADAANANNAKAPRKRSFFIVLLSFKISSAPFIGACRAKIQTHFAGCIVEGWISLFLPSLKSQTSDGTCGIWRGARVVMEQIANLSTGNRRQGSNPCLSAQVKSQRCTLAFCVKAFPQACLRERRRRKKERGRDSGLGFSLVSLPFARSRAAQRRREYSLSLRTSKKPASTRWLFCVQDQGTSSLELDEKGAKKTNLRQAGEAFHLSASPSKTWQLKRQL